MSDDPTPINHDAPSDDPMRQLVLVKQGKRFLFRFEPGHEAQVLDSLVQMVRDPECELDWFDAAVLSHQLGQSFSRQLAELRKA